MTKVLVLYHKNCPDGFTAAWAAWLELGSNAEYIPVVYGDVILIDTLKHYDKVLVLDFSFPRAVLEEWTANSISWEVIDHHKTAYDDLKGLINGPTVVCTPTRLYSVAYSGNCHAIVNFDLTKSGAMLAWERFHPNEPSSDLVRYVQDRDLWRWELPESREYAAALSSHPFDFESWSYLSEHADELTREGRGILRYQEHIVEKMASRAVWCVIGGYRVPVANATVCFSEVGELLCKLHPESKFAAYYFDRDDHKRQWGLRSRNGYDVSVIAKQYGGGGHPAAAGFTTDTEWLGGEQEDSEGMDLGSGGWQGVATRYSLDV